MLGIESESAICQPARERDSGPELAVLRRIVIESRLGLVFDEYPLLTTLLDSSRRIVYANRRSLELMDAAAEESVIGLRFGEAFGCVHARENAAGCGTSAACRFCGAARSVDEGLAGSSVSEECSISRDREGRGESLDMRIWARPIDLAGGAFVLLAAEDISAEKRREVLERVFYHDIANTASGIRSILDLIRMLPGQDPTEYLDLIRTAAGQLIDEIESQRALKAAESRELDVRPVLYDGGQALVAATGLFAYRLHGKATRVAIAPGSEHPLIETDPALLHRVLVNMLKNALEAAERDETVVAGVRVESGGEDGAFCAVFWVRNRAFMPEAIQSRLFHRSFSTKGPGRGVGTYGMRLLGEGYLGGTIRFRSEPGEGTTFELRLPSASPLL